MIPVPPSLTTRWRRSRDKDRHWYLLVEYRPGPLHLGAEYLFEPWPGCPAIRWAKFECEKVQEFLLSDAMRDLP